MHWIFKNKDHGKIAATASIGLVTLWDIEGGLPQIDKYQYSKDPYVVGGAALAVGLTCTRVSHENDPAFALLFDACESKDRNVQLPAIMGMGLAYADSNKVETGPHVSQTAQQADVSQAEHRTIFAIGSVHRLLPLSPSCVQSPVNLAAQPSPMRRREGGNG